MLLLDEPLAALDKKLREQTRLELVNIQRQTGVTFVMVTHDQEEAMTMSSRIALMRAGAIEQVGTPVEVYECPATAFAADFIGTANMFAGVVGDGGASPLVVACAELGRNLVVDSPPLPAGTAVTVMVRPEKIAISRDLPEGEVNRLAGRVKGIAYLGGSSIYHVELAGGRQVQASQANLRHLAGRDFSVDDEIFLAWHPANALVLAQ